MKQKNIFFAMGVAGFIAVMFFGNAALANHSWDGYHWARTANPLTLKLADNVSGVWDAHLATASSDWSASSVLDTNIVPGTTNPRICRATKGRVEVCNSKYGNNGWLGIAQIWVDANGHITQGITKMNDTYFSTATYNTPAWRNLVMCQEIAHAFGLDHQDEDFYNPNLGTCMDYTSNPTTNQHPNAHDYEQLVTIYSHTDAYTTLTSLSGSLFGKMRAPFVQPESLDLDLENPSEWGQAIAEHAHGNTQGKPSLFRRDLTSGESVYTFVVWAE